MKFMNPEGFFNRSGELNKDQMFLCFDFFLDDDLEKNQSKEINPHSQQRQ